MANRGRENYEYLENLAKAQRIVYDLHESKILSRFYLMQQIRGNDEAIYLEDLDINADDLIDNGIAAGEKADKILRALLDMVHNKPNLNTNKVLLSYAKKYSKNPLLPAIQIANRLSRR
jgi:hypothetical protein